MLNVGELPFEEELFGGEEPPKIPYEGLILLSQAQPLIYSLEQKGPFGKIAAGILRETLELHIRQLMELT